jgi:hypothetical protein
MSIIGKRENADSDKVVNCDPTQTPKGRLTLRFYLLWNNHVRQREIAQ